MYIPIRESTPSALPPPLPFDGDPMIPSAHPTSLTLDLHGTALRCCLAMLPGPRKNNQHKTKGY